jgi:hypothetical protein
MIPGVDAAPSANVLISNMAGPAEQLYLGGAAVRAMFGLPILPPTPCLNITFVSLMGNICLGVASTPESMSNPRRYIQFLLASFAELEQALLAKHAAAKGMSRKKVTPGKVVSRNRAGKKTALKTAVRPKAILKKTARKKT